MFRPSSILGLLFVISGLVATGAELDHGDVEDPVRGPSGARLYHLVDNRT